MITELVEKIFVHEADRSSRRREQKVDIYLNFIGMVNPSAAEVEITNTGETIEE